MLSNNEAQDICKQVLSRCGRDLAEVFIRAQEGALTRFANNSIHQNVAERNIELQVQIYMGKRRGMASSNRIDPGSLDELVERARDNAQASPEDPDHPGPPEQSSHAEVDSFDQATASYGPKERAQKVGIVCQLAKEQGMNASGAFSTGTKTLAVANSRGLFAHHISTEADFQTVVMDADASGRAHTSGWRVADIPVEELGREAVQKAMLGRKPRKIEPGEYTVILDPYVTQDLLTMLNLFGMSAQDLQDGRSWMNDHLGEQIMHPTVSVWDDGLDPKGLPAAFDVEGVPKQRTEIISRGVAKGPVYDRYTASKDGVSSTGHAIPPGLILTGSKPIAQNLFMGPGTSSLEDMLKSTERGLYITRFWYTRLVHPRDCVITGMTRDGLFLVEDGKITHALKNLRFTQSYVRALAEVEEISSETRLLLGSYAGIVTRVPALKIRAFNFTGVTV